MNDDIAFLRERDDRLRQELAATQAARAKLAVVQTEYDNAWRDVYMACLNRVAEPRAIIPLSVFRNLAIALKSNDVDVLLPEMAEELRRAVELDDTSIIRPAQLFFVAVLTEASRPGVTATKFDRFARSYSPILVQPEWFRERQKQFAKILLPALTGGTQRKLSEARTMQLEKRKKEPLSYGQRHRGGQH